jgi:hypothetical protein
MPNGYLQVNIRGTAVTVHSIVLEVFSGLRPEGRQASHLNGDRARQPRGEPAMGNSNREQPSQGTTRDTAGWRQAPLWPEDALQAGARVHAGEHLSLRETETLQDLRTAAHAGSATGANQPGATSRLHACQARSQSLRAPGEAAARLRLSLRFLGADGSRRQLLEQRGQQFEGAPGYSLGAPRGHGRAFAGELPIVESATPQNAVGARGVRPSGGRPLARPNPDSAASAHAGEAQGRSGRRSTKSQSGCRTPGPLVLSGCG